LILVRRIAAALAAAIGILIIAQLTLPRALEARIERALSRSFEEASLVRAEIRSVPAVELLWGRIDRAELELRRVVLGEIAVDAVRVDGEELWVDAPKLFRGEGVDVKAAKALRATLVLTEEDVNQYFWSRIQGAKRFRVSLERGQARVAGSFSLFGREFDVRVNGKFRVAGPASVAFVPEQVSVDDAAVPQFLIDLVASEWQLLLHFGEAPFSIAIEDLLIEDGRLWVYGARPAGG